MSVQAHGLSLVGTVREDNQDFIYQSDPEDPAAADSGHLFAVADGMGGYEHGGLASRLAIEALRNAFYDNASRSPQQAARALRNGMRDANTHVFQAAARQGVRMGTTLTGVHIHGDRLTFAHVGDSRAYLVRDGTSTSLTQDHTVVGEMVRAGVLSPDKTRTHAQRTVLRRCLGLELFVQPDVDTIRLRAGDRIILCTDGVWAMVQDAEFASLAIEYSELAALNQRLIDLALERQSDDNVSVLAIHVERTDGVAVTESSRTRPAQQRFPFFRPRFSRFSAEL